MITVSMIRAYDPVMKRRRSTLVVAIVAALTLGACGASDSTSDSSTAAPAEAATATDDDDGGGGSSASALRVVSPTDAAATIADAPDDLVILDVRTPEEFGEGHIDGAVMLDFYRDDFAVELAKLDPDVPYVLYCRSGNRSGQTLKLMEGLGFTEVDDVGGGIIEWQTVGLPLVTD